MRACGFQIKGAYRKSRSSPLAASFLFLPLCLLLLTGCASTHTAPAPRERTFNFATDTFAFANDLLWEYSYDAAGHWSMRSRDPKPEYTLHCFVLVRSAIQFFENARFAPEQPVATDKVYRRLIRKVVSSDLRHPLPPEQRIVVPGYRHLREFSEARSELLKEECGGAWQSYFQRGHWRMIFPFTHSQQEGVAQRLREAIERHEPVIIHISTFPALTINHALVLFQVAETSGQLVFQAYDPNEPAAPVTLSYDPASRTFTFPPNRYFLGGPVHVYRVYHAWNY